eukprot:scaffold20704_cov129-Isochrysis_galbana.AAC.3
MVRTSRVCSLPSSLPSLKLGPTVCMQCCSSLYLWYLASPTFVTASRTGVGKVSLSRIPRNEYRAPEAPPAILGPWRWINCSPAGSQNATFGPGCSAFVTTPCPGTIC